MTPLDISMMSISTSCSLAQLYPSRHCKYYGDDWASHHPLCYYSHESPATSCDEPFIFFNLVLPSLYGHSLVPRSGLQNFTLCTKWFACHGCRSTWALHKNMYRKAKCTSRGIYFKINTKSTRSFTREATLFVFFETIALVRLVFLEHSCMARLETVPRPSWIHE